MKIAGCMVCSTVYLAELTKKLSFDPDNLLDPGVCQSTTSGQIIYYSSSDVSKKVD